MSSQQVKRSSTEPIGTPPGAAVPGDGRVGARQAGSAPAARGGGYQSTRGISNVEPINGDRDSRLDELRAMGLQARWLRIAETIGIDAFLAMWRILDADPSIRTDKGDLEVTLRPYRSYLRFQRNRYIETLVGQGLGVREIQRLVKTDLCEVITIRHISRIRSGA